MDNYYILNRDQAAQDRLYLQHTVYERSSRRFLLTNGLRPGHRVLEVACGPGFMTEVLVRLVGESGAVDSFDISPAYVKVAQQRLADYPQVTITHSDILQFQSSYQYDFIYCRMILHHLPEPRKALKKLTQLLAPGGIMVCEEPPTAEGSYTVPLSKAMALVNGLATALFREQRLNYEVAYHLPCLLQQVGLGITCQQVFQPRLSPEKRQLIPMGLKEIGPTLVAKRWLDERELSSLQQHLYEDTKSAAVVTGSRMFQVAAKRTH